MKLMIGKEAPLFRASAVLNGNEIVEDFSLEQYRGKKYVLFFFYPKDFTFVCPTELIAFQEKLSQFDVRQVAVVGCSTDSEFSHWKWLNTERKDGGIKGVTYPLVADLSKAISENFGVLAGRRVVDQDTGMVSFEGNPVAYRGLFLLDKEGVVRHQLINDMPIGRSVDEALRVVDALQFCEKHGEVCPAGWNSGDDTISENQESIAAYLKKKG